MQIQSPSEVLKVRTSNYESVRGGRDTTHAVATPRQKLQEAELACCRRGSWKLGANDGHTNKGEEPERP